jgi:hypothetical protein
MLFSCKIVSKTIETGKLRVGEFFFEVPLDYSEPQGETIRVFARSVRRAAMPPEPDKDDKQLPWLLYLNGGPGGGCYQPQDYSWVRIVLDKGYQV